MPLRFLHVSDIHLLNLAGVPLWRYLNKRLTGWVNLAVRRKGAHDGRLFREAVAHARDLGVSHLVVTGDLTNLALEAEFEFVRDELRRTGLAVTVIPGNHDAYTRGAERTGRFEAYMGEFMQGERLEADAPYPYVQRYGDVALVGVSTAVATLPLHATGRVGEAQLGRLETSLARLGEEGLARVVLIHHPVIEGVSRPRHDLLDLGAFGAVLSRTGAELVLHGHEHKWFEGELAGPRAAVPVHGISSGTSLATTVARRAGFSIYDVEAGGFQRRRFRWEGTGFVEVEREAGTGSHEG